MVNIGIGRDEKVIKNSEYRNPSPKPKFPLSRASILAFPLQWDEYWRDVFPRRGSFIYLHAYIRYILLAANAPGSISLENGFIFGLWNIDPYRGRDLRTDREVDNLIKLIIQKHKFFEKAGIAYYFVLAPSRIRYYRNILPKYFELPDQHAMTTKMLNRMPPEMTKYFIMPDARMLEAQVQYPDRHLFFRRDNHWNHWGRAVAASAIIQFLQTDFPELPSLNLEQIPFVVEPEDRSFCIEIRRLGVNYDLFPVPLNIKVDPSWERKYKAMQSDPRGRSLLKMAYVSDSFMEILADQPPEILSFSYVKRLKDSISNPATLQKVLDDKPDILLESVYIDALAIRQFYKPFMERNADWLSLDQ